MQFAFEPEFESKKKTVIKKLVSPEANKKHIERQMFAQILKEQKEVILKTG